MSAPVTEIATCFIKVDKAPDFEASMAALHDIFSRAQGYRGFSLLKVDGKPAVYQMLVEWDSIHHHRDLFRGSAEFDAMIELLGDHFDGPAALQYTHQIFRA